MKVIIEGTEIETDGFPEMSHYTVDGVMHTCIHLPSGEQLHTSESYEEIIAKYNAAS